MAFTAQDVKALRESTGAGMMDCKKALEETGGDIEAAKQYLREKGLAASAKRDDRENNQGVVALKVDGKKRFWQMLEHVERRLPEQGFALGDRYSLCDAYLTVFYLWARRFELPASDLPRYSRLVAQVLPRPAVRRALEQEGYAHLYQPERNQPHAP